MKAALILSGGMDSGTLAYYLKRKMGYDELLCITFDYGQRHAKEIECAAWIAEDLDAQHEVIDISGIRPLLKGSALTDDVDVPHGHYEAENMRLTVVPNRNAIMLSLAWGIAAVEQCDALASGVHSGDHFIYPDCRPDFYDAMRLALRLGTEGHRPDGMKLIAPFIDISKIEIALIGGGLGVPYEHTWTCYEGGDVHCGECGACQERQEGFRVSGVVDPVPYK